jgi:hypothetical protein
MLQYRLGHPKYADHGLLGFNKDRAPRCPTSSTVEDDLINWYGILRWTAYEKRTVTETRLSDKE